MWPSLAREAPAPERMTVGGFRPGQVAHKLEQHSGPSTLKRRPCQELLWGSSVRQIPREWQGPRELLAPCGWSPQPPAQLGSPRTFLPCPQGPVRWEHCNGGSLQCPTTTGQAYLFSCGGTSLWRQLSPAQRVRPHAWGIDQPQPAYLSHSSKIPGQEARFWCPLSLPLTPTGKISRGPLI